jgi:hypothetical protein
MTVSAIPSDGGMPFVAAFAAEISQTGMSWCQ